MVDKFVSYATGPAHAAGEPGAVIRHDCEGEIELVNLIWGWPPREKGGRPLTHLRSEGRRFGARRCLIPASQFSVANGEGATRRKWRATLVGRDELFYLAAVWRPAEGDWPASYALITMKANPDIAPYQDRQVAVIRRADRWNWLDHLKPQDDLLSPHPKGTFGIEQIEGPASLFDWKADAA